MVELDHAVDVPSELGQPVQIETEVRSEVSKRSQLIFLRVLSDLSAAGFISSVLDWKELASVVAPIHDNLAPSAREHSKDSP